MASALLSQKLYLRLGRGEFMITIKDKDILSINQQLVNFFKII